MPSDQKQSTDSMQSSSKFQHNFLQALNNSQLHIETKTKQNQSKANKIKNQKNPKQTNQKTHKTSIHKIVGNNESNLGGITITDLKYNRAIVIKNSILV